MTNGGAAQLVEVYRCLHGGHPPWFSLEQPTCPLCGNEAKRVTYAPIAWLIEIQAISLSHEARSTLIGRDLLDTQHELALLLDAISEHEKAVEREISKSWSRANAELRAVRVLVERSSGRAS